MAIYSTKNRGLLMMLVTLLGATFTSCHDDNLGDPTQSGDVMRFAVADRITRSAGSEPGSEATMHELTAAGLADTLYMYSNVTDIEGSIVKDKTRAALDGGTGDFLLSCALENGGKLVNYYFRNEEYNDKGDNLDGKEYYWLNTGTQDFRFYGIAPAAESGKAYDISYPAPDERPVIAYTVPDDPAYQIDLKAVTTEPYADNYKKVVPLSFKHLLTAITFEADESVFPGKILGIKIEGVRNNGRYDMQDEQWTSLAGTATYTLAPDKEVDTDNTEITPAGEVSFFLMPQTLPEGAKITVRYENSVSHKQYELSADLAGMTWPAGKVVNYLISTSGITGQQIGLHIHGTADKAVLPAKVSLTPLGSSQELLDYQPVVTSTSFDLNAPTFIDNLVDLGLTGKQFYRLTLTNTSDPANSQELLVEYHFDYMAFTVDITKSGETIVMPFDAVALGGQTPGKHPSTLMFRWQPGDFSQEIKAVTEENMTKAYNTTGKRQVRVYSSITGNTAVPGYLTSTKKNNFPAQTVSVDTKLLKGPNNALSRLFLNCSKLASVPADLFVDNGQIIDLVQTFQSCTALTSLPSGLFDPLVNAQNFEGTFRASGIKRIPAGLFDKCVSANTFSSTFHQCVNLEAIPAGLFDHCPQGAWFNNTFQGCSKITEIPAGLFANNPKAMSFSFTFQVCTSIKSVPGDIFRGCRLAYDFNNTFQGCTSLTTVGDGLFDDCVKAKEIHATFMNTSIKSIPARFFAKCPVVTTFAEVFSNCPNLTSVPSDIFDGCSVATNFSQAFNNCTGLTSIPSDLFATNLKAQNFSSTFNKCHSLRAIPAGLFSANKEATTFNATFEYCSGINQPLPAGLFKGLSKATDFTLTFRGCTNMPGALPADTFKGCSSARSFTSTFFECSSLEGPIPEGFFQDCDKARTTSFFATFCHDTNLKGPIPADLFKGFTNVTDMSSFFYGCRFLSGNIPANLFADQPKLKNLFSFFAFCNSLTGDIPAGLFAVNTQLENVSTMFYNCNLLRKIPETLFDNCPKINNLSQTFAYCFWITGNVPELWKKYPDASHKACFYRVGLDGDNTQSYVSNYDAIPADWKGAPDASMIDD